MKLFVLLSRVPYPHEKGDKLRAFNHIKYLSKNHEIILCALNDTKIHKDAFESLKPYCKTISIIKLSKLCIIVNILKSLFTGNPLQVGYFYSNKAGKKINALIKENNPDHIFCQLIRVTEYVKHIDIPKTLDYQDAFSKGIERRIDLSPFYMKPLLKMEYIRLKKYENHIFRYFDNKIIISYQDRDLIEHKEKDKIIVVSNGVDTGFFKPMQRGKKYDLLFTGNMSYIPNVISAEFLVKKILPEVKRKYPQVKLMLAGASPGCRIKALRSDNVEITGWVDDIRNCYAMSKIFIAPMQIGIGLQNKLLEAMAMQLPCITSHLANNALSAKENHEILIGSNVEEYVKHIFFLLKNKDKAHEIALNGYNFVLTNYNWEKLTEKLSHIIES